MKIEMEYVPGTPGDVQLIDVTHYLNQSCWLIDPEADREATRELAAELRLMGATPTRKAITCKVNRRDGERLVPKDCGFQIAVKIAHQQGRTAGFLEEKLLTIEGNHPTKYLIGEVRRGSVHYEVFVIAVARGWEAFEAPLDGRHEATSGRSLGRAARLPEAAGLGREHVMAHGARTRRRIVPRPTRREVSHV